MTARIVDLLVKSGRDEMELTPEALQQMTRGPETQDPWGEINQRFYKGMEVDAPLLPWTRVNPSVDIPRPNSIAGLLATPVNAALEVAGMTGLGFDDRPSFMLDSVGGVAALGSARAPAAAAGVRGATVPKGALTSGMGGKGPAADALGDYDRSMSPLEYLRSRGYEPEFKMNNPNDPNFDSRMTLRLNAPEGNGGAGYWEMDVLRTGDPPDGVTQTRVFRPENKGVEISGRSEDFFLRPAANDVVGLDGAYETDMSLPGFSMDPDRDALDLAFMRHGLQEMADRGVKRLDSRPARQLTERERALYDALDAPGMNYDADEFLYAGIPMESGQKFRGAAGVPPGAMTRQDKDKQKRSQIEELLMGANK